MCIYLPVISVLYFLGTVVSPPHTTPHPLQLSWGCHTPIPSHPLQLRQGCHPPLPHLLQPSMGCTPDPQLLQMSHPPSSPIQLTLGCHPPSSPTCKGTKTLSKRKEGGKERMICSPHKFNAATLRHLTHCKMSLMQITDSKVTINLKWWYC